MRTVGALRDPGGMGTDESAARASLERQIRFVLEADSAALARQEEAERAAADRIFALLPEPQAAQVRALWDEFEERRTPEARFARALDRLQPMLLNMRTGGGTWVAHGVPLEQVLAKVALIEDGSASLGRYAREMIAAAVEQGFLGPVAGPPAG